MKSKQFIITLFLISSLLLFSNNTYNPNYLRTQLTEVIEEDTLCIEEVSLPPNFEMIYTAFKSYNPYIDSSSAFSFTNVVNCFGLNEFETLRWSLGQVLLESGAKQYYQPTHPKEGQLVVSSAGAIGFTQILPSTAYGYMIKKVSEEDKEYFKRLGVTDYSFAYNSNYTKSKKISMCKKWLTNENNNMVMWGKIMSSKLKSKSILDALISYNAGTAGLNRFLNAGNTQTQHKYIRGIKTRLKYVNL